MDHEGVAVAPGGEHLVHVHERPQEPEGQVQDGLVAVEVDEESGPGGAVGEPPLPGRSQLLITLTTGTYDVLAVTTSTLLVEPATQVATVLRRPDDKKARESQAVEETGKLALARRAEDATKVEEARKAEERQRIAEAKKAEEARKADEARQVAEAQRVEEVRKAEELQRIAEAKKAEEARKVEEARQVAEAQRVEKARKAEEARKVEEARQVAEAQRIEKAKAEVLAQHVSSSPSAVPAGLQVAALPERQPNSQQTTISAAQPARAPPPAQSERLVTYGDRYLAQGNVAIARQYFLRAAQMEHARAAFKLAETYDPHELARLNVSGLRSDLVEAKSWYARASQFGAEDAKARLARLGGE